MTNTYWYKQNPEMPLFPDLLWSRPENKQSAGKLLIVGGNQFGFAAVAEAYSAAVETGAGLTRVLLPLSVKKAAGNVLPGVEYAAATPSGGFAQNALEELLAQAAWADAALFAGNLGRNSEMAILLEKFLAKHLGQTTLTKDAVDYCLALPEQTLGRPDILLVLTMAQLQKLATAARFDQAFTLSMDLLHLVAGLHTFTTQHPVKIIVKHLEQVVVAVDGQISTTRLNKDMSLGQVKPATQAAVWWLQNPTKPFEALTTALIANNPTD